MCTESDSLTSRQNESRWVDIKWTYLGWQAAKDQSWSLETPVALEKQVDE